MNRNVPIPFSSGTVMSITVGCSESSLTAMTIQFKNVCDFRMHDSSNHQKPIQYNTTDGYLIHITRGILSEFFYWLTQDTTASLRRTTTKTKATTTAMFYSFFRVIPRSLNFICLRFGAFCLFHFHRSCEQEEWHQQSCPIYLMVYTTHENGRDRLYRNVST